MEMILTFTAIKKKVFGDKLTHDYLLINTRLLNPMGSNTLTKYINKIFSPKNVSTTILRKVYLSYKYPIKHSISEMQRDAYVMGHDIGTARKIYTKKL
jgi:hypothetical protein